MSKSMVNIFSNFINNYLKKNYTFLFIILLIFINIIPYSKLNNIEKSIPSIIITKKNEEVSIGTIIIKKINLKENLYPINSNENDVEKHVAILKESIFPPAKNSIVFLAAHSGTGNIAYFERLDELNQNDEIILIYNNEKYIYQVKNSWEEKKNGFININKEKENQLILTTCSPNKNNYQLIINCIEKESN